MSRRRREIRLAKPPRAMTIIVHQEISNDYLIVLAASLMHSWFNPMQPIRPANFQQEDEYITYICIYGAYLHI